MVRARELLKSGGAEILIGGRGAQEARVDMRDAASLDAFCGRCGVIVNCGGPVVMSAGSRGATGILPRDATTSIPRGWMPGITELLPLYAHAQAQSQMDSVESVSVYFGDSGEWSDNALRDGVFHLRKAGMPSPKYFRKGERVVVKMPAASRKVDLSHRAAQFQLDRAAGDG